MEITNFIKPVTSIAEAVTEKDRASNILKWGIAVVAVLTILHFNSEGTGKTICLTAVIFFAVFFTAVYFFLLVLSYHSKESINAKKEHFDFVANVAPQPE